MFNHVLHQGSLLNKVVAVALAAGVPAISLASVMSKDNCNIDLINGGMVTSNLINVAKDRPLQIIGWAIDQQRHNVPLNLHLKITSENGKYVDVAVQHRVFRPDVVKALGSDAYMIAGFSATVPASSLKFNAGLITLHYSFGGDEYVCDKGLAIHITDYERRH